MFSKDEASRIKHEFWTTFGRYMSPVLSAEGMKTNWVNYHTGLKDVYFRMNAGGTSAAVSISMEHRDLNLQELFFDQLLELKSFLHDSVGEEWEWRLQEQVDGKVVSRVYKEIRDVSIFRKEDWHALISFFKPRIIALDTFWMDAKWNFESLR